jgi:sensor histidine kinase YesM
MGIWGNLKERASGGSWIERVLGLVGARRQWVIHPKFQGKVVMFGLTIAGFSLVVTAFALKYFFWRTLNVLHEAGLPYNHPIYAFVLEQERWIKVLYLGVALLSTAFAFVMGLALSHRVAGPIYRLRKHLLEAAAGRAPSQVRFRDEDYFQELADAYNAELRSRGRVRRPGSEPSRADQSRRDEAA